MNHNLMYTVDYSFGYCSKKIIHTYANLSAHTPGTEIRDGNLKHFKTCVRRAR